MVVPPPRGEYLSAGGVATLLHVSPKTVTRWAAEGKLPCVRTLGGHRRFPGAQIQELAERLSTPDGHQISDLDPPD
jgi:excisionase family DNA binding protein